MTLLFHAVDTRLRICVHVCVFDRCVQRTVSSYYRQQLHLSKQGGHHHVIEDPDVGTSMPASMQGDGSGPSTSSSLPSDAGPGKSEISYVITLVLSREFTHSIAAFRVRPLRPCVWLSVCSAFLRLCLCREILPCALRCVRVRVLDKLTHTHTTPPPDSADLPCMCAHRRFS